MREMADRNLVFLLDIAEEGTLVVYAKREDAVLIGDREAGAVDGAVFCAARWVQG